jgi:predicted acylesterase/phospholipase RssA
MPKYIAITVAGAVSLGCYEAGVLYEMLEAIAQHNNDPQTKAQKDFIYVDIIIGASAGAMSSAILTQHLLWDGESLRDSATNPLYLPWVQKISLDELLTPLPDDANIFGVRSILSSALIDKI